MKGRGKYGATEACRQVLAGVKVYVSEGCPTQRSPLVFPEVLMCKRDVRVITKQEKF